MFSSHNYLLRNSLLLENFREMQWTYQRCILEGLCARVNEAVIRKFKVIDGGQNTMMHGHVATMKRQDGTMDLAVAVQQADFKLEPEEIHHKNVKRFFGIVYDIDRWVERRERTLSENDRQYP